MEEIFQRKIQLIAFKVPPTSDNFSKIDLISSIDIKNTALKYFSKPFLSINGDKNICDAIKQRWFIDG